MAAILRKHGGLTTVWEVRLCQAKRVLLTYRAWFEGTVGCRFASAARITCSRSQTERLSPSQCIMAKSNRSTSAKSKSRSAKVDRPFDPALLARARKIAGGYRIIIRHEDGEYYGQALELAGAMNDGKTPAECIEKTIDIVTTTVATLLERGEIPPLPASDERRDEQVNIRLSKLEKVMLEEAAHSRGYRGLSDFMRAATLASIATTR